LRQTLTHQIVGYDPLTEKLVLEVDIPKESWEEVKSILKEGDGDHEYLYIHKIDYGKAVDILGLVHTTGARGLDYYIECSSGAA